MNSIEDIIEEYGQGIYKYCYRMLRNTEEAEDAVQEVFIKAYHNIHRLDGIKSVSSWLYKIAYNHCLNLIRRKKLFSFLTLKEELKADDVYCDTSIEESEFGEELARIMSRLSPQDRSVLILRVIEEKSYEEIGAMFSKHPDAVRKQYERTKKKVKRYLDIEEGVKSCEKISIL